MNERPGFREPAVPEQAGRRPQHSVDQLRTQPILKAGMDLDMLRRHDTRPRVQGELSDSSSLASAGMEPASIRTRGRSIITEATSVSGRCSSLSSQKPPSPSSPKMDSVRPRAWYGARVDSRQAELGSGIRYSCSMSALPHPGLDGGGNDSSDSSPDTASEISRARTTTALHFPVARYGDDLQPHTSPNQVRLEKPRIINIPPSVPATHEQAFTGRDRHVEGSAHSTSDLQDTTAVNSPPISGQAPHHERFLRTKFSGRSVVNVAGQSLISPVGKDKMVRHIHAPSAPLAMHSGERLDPEQHALSPMRKPTNLGQWIDERAETPALAQNTLPYLPNTSMPGIPLPPEVVESLQVSISCFPETMLLSSSFSIETIRSYSKKLKHRADLDHHLRSHHDRSSSLSSISSNAKQTKRWNLAWLRQHQHQSQHHSQYAPRSPQNANNISTLSLANRTAAMPSWAPIKNVFPAASDYLCDALFAHLVAYNYITSLCPPAPPQSHQHYRQHQYQHSNRGAPVDGHNRDNIRIPDKAASVLGMEDAGPATKATSRQSNDGHRRRPMLTRAPSRSPAKGTSHNHSHSRRGSGSGSGNGNGGADASATMREVQAGLARCIALLVATLRRGAPIGGGRVDLEAQGQGRKEDNAADTVLMRALCEVVRCAEEAVMVVDLS